MTRNVTRIVIFNIDKVLIGRYNHSMIYSFILSRVRTDIDYTQIAKAQT